MGLFRIKNKKNMQNRSDSRALRIYIEHAGTILYEINSNDYAKEIVIGRSMDVAWSLDGVDTSASARHAVISRRKNAFYITDLGSRNGLYFKNRRLKEKKLQLGDRISLGECIVVVEVADKKSKGSNRFNQIEYTNEKGRRTLIDITKTHMVIGSGSDCDIIFPDQLVSAHHAELTLRNDGSCWIRDLGSRNGTSVNGAELSPESERMLQDGDAVTIAYMDLKYLDAGVEHHESKLWFTIVTVALTAMIVLAFYIAYMTLVIPPSEQILKLANLEMEKGNFEHAKELIAKSKNARNAEVTHDERDRLLKRLNKWEAVITLWESIKDDLASNRFNVALQKLSSISGDDVNMWSWRYNGMSGGEERIKADIIKNLLSTCSATGALVGARNTTVSDIEKARAELAKSILKAEDARLDYLDKVLESARGLLGMFDKVLAEDKELRETLALLEAERPDYQAIIQSLDKLSRESGGHVKARADKVMGPIDVLNRETLKMMGIIAKVHDMEFDEIEKFELDLPDTIDYSVEKNLGNLRKNLIETVKRFKDASAQLSNIHRKLISKGVEPGKEIAVLTLFSDPATMIGVYSFDSLDMPLPKLSRKEPSGKYDELLGVEYFYDYVSNIQTMMTVNIEDLGFKPAIYQTRDVINDVEKFVNFANRDENQWFNEGKFKEFLSHCRSVLALRDRIVKEQSSRKFLPGTREHLVSRGIAMYLSGNFMNSKRDEISDSFNKYRQGILKLNKEFNQAMPEEQMQIRKTIIETGLPGDPILKNMWRQRPADGWKK